MELRDNPQAAALAAQIQQEKGFDVLDESAVQHAITRRAKLRFNRFLWILAVAPGTLIAVLGIMVWSGPQHPGDVTAGIVLFILGLPLAGYPLFRVVRSYRTEIREINPVILGHLRALRAAGPEFESRYRSFRRNW